MNRLWLKIIGCVIVVLVVALAVYVFWPTGPAYIAESKDTEQVQKPAEPKLGTEAKLQRLFPERSAGLYQSRAPQSNQVQETKSIAEKVVSKCFVS